MVCTDNIPGVDRGAMCEGYDDDITCRFRSSNTMVAGTFSNYCTLIIHWSQATEITDTAILTGLQSKFVMDNCSSKLNQQ